MNVVGIGVPYNALQNEVVALPSTLCQVMVTVACEVSVNGTLWTAFTNNTITAAAFIRCTTAASTILAKSAVIQSSSGGGTSIGPTTDLAVNTLALGTNPAQSGVIRIPNNQPIRARNAANTADLDLINVSGSNQTLIGNATGLTFITGAGVTINSVLTLPASIQANLGGVVLIQAAGILALEEKSTGFPTPHAGRAYIYAEDVAGKTRIMALFGTGAAVQIAIEP